MERTDWLEDMGYAYHAPQETAPRAEANFAETKPTPDQLYLADKLNEVAPKGRISIPGLVKLNKEYGIPAVTGALRMARGFTPDVLHSAYAYVEKLCKEAR